MCYILNMKKTALAVMIIIFALGLSSCVKTTLRAGCGHCVTCGTCRG